MKFGERLYALYILFPYSKKLGFTFSILFASKVKIFNYDIDVRDYLTILHIFAVKRYSKIFTLENNGIKFSLDGKNYFTISRFLDKRDRVLLALFDEGIKTELIFLMKIIIIKETIIKQLKFHKARISLRLLRVSNFTLTT